MFRVYFYNPGLSLTQRDVDLKIYKTKGKQTLWKKDAFTKFQSRLISIIGGCFWLKGCFFFNISARKYLKGLDMRNIRKFSKENLAPIQILFTVYSVMK